MCVFAPSPNRTMKVLTLFDQINLCFVACTIMYLRNLLLLCRPTVNDVIKRIATNLGFSDQIVLFCDKAKINKRISAYYTKGGKTYY